MFRKPEDHKVDTVLSELVAAVNKLDAVAAHHKQRADSARQTLEESTNEEIRASRISSKISELIR